MPPWVQNREVYHLFLSYSYRRQEEVISRTFSLVPDSYGRCWLLVLVHNLGIFRSWSSRLCIQVLFGFSARLIPAYCFFSNTTRSTWYVVSYVLHFMGITLRCD